jgi:hypothetical protein
MEQASSDRSKKLKSCNEHQSKKMPNIIASRQEDDEEAGEEAVGATTGREAA